MHIEQLMVWPVKGCAGLDVPEWPVDARGLLLDRAWMLVGPDGGFLSQRTHPQLALVRTALDLAHLTLTWNGTRLVVPLDPPERPQPVQVRVWDDDCEAWDEGDAAAAWFQHVGVDARLVRMTDAWQRQVDPRYAPAGVVTGFSDGFPVLVATSASLADLNAHLDAPVTMQRFRPNVVIAGAQPWDEDGWRRLQAGDVTLELVKPCARCQVPAVDPETGVPGHEPVRTLAKLRRVEGKVLFGVNALATTGVLKVGCPIVLLPPTESPLTGHDARQPPD